MRVSWCNITEYRIPRMDNATCDRNKIYISFTANYRYHWPYPNARYLRNSWASCTQFYHRDENVSYEKRECTNDSNERLTDRFRTRNTTGQWDHRTVVGGRRTYISVTKWAVLFWLLWTRQFNSVLLELFLAALIIWIFAVGTVCPHCTKGEICWPDKFFSKYIKWI